MFTAFVVFSYMIFFGFIVYLESADWPTDQGIAAIPPELMNLILDEPEPPEEPTDEVSEEVVEEEAEEVVEEATSDPTPQQSDAERQQAQTEAQARIVNEARAQAEAMLLGAFGDS